MKILFVLPRMVAGGVERVTLSLIRGLIGRGHDCQLALGRCRGEFVEEARALCVVHELAPGSLLQFAPSLTALVDTWRPTHVVTAFSDVGALSWIAMRRARHTPRWIHGVHNSHVSSSVDGRIISKIRNWRSRLIDSFVYRHAHALVAVSDGVREELAKLFHIPSNRLTRIYNPALSLEQLDQSIDLHKDSSDVKRICAIGRLHRQKGFDLLISAMARVPGCWTLDIWGEGGERKDLQTLIDQYHLADRVQLRGFAQNSLSVLRDAHLLVSPSRSEAFGLVLVEALASHCQIIATDCPHGPREILMNGEYGKLVPPESAEALAGAITLALSGQVDIDAAALTKRAAMFSLEQACCEWEALLQRT